MESYDEKTAENYWNCYVAEKPNKQFPNYQSTNYQSFQAITDIKYINIIKILIAHVGDLNEYFVKI